jgi:hypothetical protein
MIRALGAALVLTVSGAAAVAAGPGSAAPPPAPAASALPAAVPAPTTQYHYTVNLEGHFRPVARLGFNVMDVGPSRAMVRTLPRGTKGLVYVGQDCPHRVNRAFRREIRPLAHNPRVLGYFLSDEPDERSCPRAPAALASRADYIRRVSHGTQRSFIVLTNDGPYRAFRPAVTHVSMVGLDPYPCSKAHPRCAYYKIRQAVTEATRAGIPKAAIVPVFQAFGQERTRSHYYNLPTTSQLRRILARWAVQVPHPIMDYTYSWGNQSSSNPTLRNAPGLQRLLSSYFAG